MDWRTEVGHAAYAFRGYNYTNLGRTPELLAEPAYETILQTHLEHASTIGSDILGRSIDLVARVKQTADATLESYDEAICLIMAVELGQLALLSECHGIGYESAQFACGYSLGEITALVAGGVFRLEEALAIPLSFAVDCVELAQDVRLGILFSRGQTLPFPVVERILVKLNQSGQGVIGVSAFLSPNTLLIMGSGTTLDRLVEHLKEIQPKGVHLRINEHHWPPLHTPLVWQRQISDRAGTVMHVLRGGMQAPTLPVLSMVTGEFSYNDYNARSILTQWVDHPQRLWDVVCETLARDIDTVVHIGPQPNIIPATFKRLAANVEGQMSRRRMRALSAAVRQSWLKGLLPKRASLLRAPYVKQLILEDWLLDNVPS